MRNEINFDYWPPRSSEKSPRYKINIATDSPIPTFIDSADFPTFYHAVNGFVAMLDQYGHKLNLEQLKISTVNLKKEELSEIERILSGYKSRR